VYEKANVHLSGLSGYFDDGFHFVGAKGEMYEL